MLHFEVCGAVTNRRCIVEAQRSLLSEKEENTREKELSTR
jgi:hypothetical protein